MSMRSRTVFLPLSFILVTLSFALPVVAQAGGIPFFGPIVPEAYNRCAAGWGLLMEVINNLISFLLTIVIVFIAPLMIAYSGFLFVLNPVNASGKEEAKKILTNTVVGIVIALAGWMIVDAVMAVLYNPKDAGSTWTNLITTGGSDFCILLKASLNQAQQTGVPTVGITPGGGVGKFTFNPGIDAQVATESVPLAGLLSCMGDKLTTNAIITSISDSAITSGKATIEQCAASGKKIGCAHTANSCHYGGRNCTGASYAVDLAGDLNALATIANQCGASSLNEGNHLHVSVGQQNGCGCDAGLD